MTRRNAPCEVNLQEAVDEMRQKLETIFEKHDALFLTGDKCATESMLGFHKSKPIFGIRMFEGGNDFETQEDEEYDVPWLIDLATGVMELPTLKLTFTLEEWVAM